MAERRSIIGMPLAFDDQEYSDRVDRARQALSDANLDALLIFHQESMYYLFGYDQLGYWVYQAAILTPDKRSITMILRVADFDLVNGLPFVDDIRTWHDDSSDVPATVTLDALRSLGVLGANRRVGIELRSHALLPYHYEALRTAVTDKCDLIDASDLVTELRLRKSETEVKYVRRAALVQDAGYKAAFNGIHPGARESDVVAAAVAAMLAAGGEIPAIMPPTSSGPRTLSRTHGAATDRVLQIDEPFCIELGACYRRYHAVGVQTKWIGNASEAIRRDYNILLEALEAGVAAVRPGAATAEVARRANGTLSKYGAYEPGNHVGYGTGIGYPPTWLDNLRIKQTDEHVLESNMLFFLFMHSTYAADAASKGVLFVGAPILVVPGGAEQLSHVQLSLDLP